MPDIFSPEATQRQLEQLGEQPPEQGGIGVVVNGKDVGVQGAVNKDVGKPGGWFVLAEGSWMRRAGGSVAGWLGWKGKDAK